MTIQYNILKGDQLIPQMTKVQPIRTPLTELAIAREHLKDIEKQLMRMECWDLAEQVHNHINVVRAHITAIRDQEQVLLWGKIL